MSRNYMPESSLHKKPESSRHKEHESSRNKKPESSSSRHKKPESSPQKEPESSRPNTPRHNHAPSTGSRFPPTYQFSGGSNATETTPTAKDYPEHIKSISYKEAQRLFQLPYAQELFKQYKDGVQELVLNKLNKLVVAEETLEVLILMVDYTDLLRLLGISSPIVNDIAAQARERLVRRNSNR